MHKLIEDLNWRYATKKFDPTKKISSDDLEVIKESLRLVPTSYGLQSMKFLIVESKEIREQLLLASFGQKQIVDASHLLVLCAYKDITPIHIDAYAENIANTRDHSVEAVAGYRDFIKRTVSSMSEEQKTAWNSKQLYIALGQLMTTCANLRIDATPMEGFNASKVDEILELNKKNLTSVLLCPIGFRHEDDDLQFAKKVRKSHNDLFETI